MFTFEELFKRLFAPTSQSLMFKFFRDLASLVKSNGKKSSQMWKLLLKNGLKLPRQKKFFTHIFLPLFTPFKRLFAPIFRIPMTKLFRFSKSFEETNGKKWSQIWLLLLIKGVKLPQQKVWFSKNFALLAIFFWYRCYYPHRSHRSYAGFFHIPSVI